MSNIVQRFKVPERSELRIEVGETECHVTVTEGTAEIFGAVVQLHRKLRLQHTKIALFSYDGCSVTLEGLTSETPCDSLCSRGQMAGKPCACCSL